jgi:iron complex transport system permease protein
MGQHLGNRMRIKYPIMFFCTVLVLGLGVMIGSVPISLGDIFKIIIGALMKQMPEGISDQMVSIVLNIRLPRVLTAMLVGGTLSLSGAAMQGLLKNPLADGSTLGVSSGASLGAVIAIAFSTSNTIISNLGIAFMSVLFAFISMFIILGLAQVIDYSMSTNTIILIGVIFSMFSSSITSFIITIASNKVKNIVFWSMGSLSATTYKEVGVLVVMLGVTMIILFHYGLELNAFAVGEDNARHIGINVKRVKLIIMIVVSIMIGISVSISGTIGFVGLIIPHITRLLTGPDHKKLLPMSIFAGGMFLVIADLISRTIVSPVELPIGVITSFVGSILFIYLFYKLYKK